MDEIEELVVEEDRPRHIAKHKVKVSDVLEVVSGDYVYIKGRLSRWLLIGKTNRERFLTIIVGKRRKKGAYGLVTARPAHKKERKFYQEFTFQIGEENGKN